MNVVFSNGWIADEDGRVFIYYASSDTRMHVATSTVDRLVDYCLHTPQDGLTTSASVETIKKLIAKKPRTMKIGLSEKIGYGLGDMSSSMFWKLFGAYLMIFYTDVFGISAAIVGTMFAVTRVWDSLFDPYCWCSGRPYIITLGDVSDRIFSIWQYLSAL